MVTVAVSTRTNLFFGFQGLIVFISNCDVFERRTLIQRVKDRQTTNTQVVVVVAVVLLVVV